MIGDSVVGYRQREPGTVLSHGVVNLAIATDPVGAPIFYRDVPLMPSEGERGVIKPLPQSAIGLIKWRLRDVGESESRTLMENLPTCANCHSFSLDGRTLGLDVDGPQNDKGLYALVSVMSKNVNQFCAAYLAAHRSALARQPGYLSQSTLGWVMDAYGELHLRWDLPGELPFPMPVEVVVGDKRQRVAMPEGKATLKVPEGTEVRLDPDGWVLRQTGSGRRER